MRWRRKAPKSPGSRSDFPLPIYDGDLYKSGVPKHAVNLKRMMAAHHGVLIVTPEYTRCRRW